MHLSVGSGGHVECMCRRRFQACPDVLAAAGHKGAKELFDVEAPPEHEITSTRLMDNGEYRCEFLTIKACLNTMRHVLTRRRRRSTKSLAPG